MLPNFPSLESFATGAIPYEYRPAYEDDLSNRILIQVEVQIVAPVLETAILDTGSPYMILSPKVAKDSGFTQDRTIDRTVLKIRGYKYEGSITRLNVTLPAVEGQSLSVDTTAFIPDREDAWGDFPSFVGCMGFLERLRFAIDPNTDTFYFGSL